MTIVWDGCQEVRQTGSKLLSRPRTSGQTLLPPSANISTGCCERGKLPTRHADTSSASLIWRRRASHAGKRAEWNLRDLGRELVAFPEIYVESFDVDVPAVLRPACDMLWNAFDFLRCDMYDTGGDGWARARVRTGGPSSVQRGFSTHSRRPAVM